MKTVTELTVTADRVCAWCDKSMGTVEVDPLTAAIGTKSHGMCPNCFAEYMHGLKESDVIKIKDMPWATATILEFIDVSVVGVSAKMYVDDHGVIYRGLKELEKAADTRPARTGEGNARKHALQTVSYQTEYLGAPAQKVTK